MSDSLARERFKVVKIAAYEFARVYRRSPIRYELKYFNDD